MHTKRRRARYAWMTVLALAAPACSGDTADDLAATAQDLVGPPGAASEVIFPRTYSDVQLGRGIRTVTSSRMAGSCVELPKDIAYQVTNRAWRSEGVAVASQAELAQKFGLDVNLSVAHGPASGNLGMEVMRDSSWTATSMKLVIKAVYTYDVIVANPDTSTLTQNAYDIIKPPAAGDTDDKRKARARAFLKQCGRYWDKGVKKGAELAIVYSFNNTTREQRESLTGTAGASVPGATTVGGKVTVTQQEAFKTAIQGAQLKVYGHGFKIEAGDPLTPIAKGLDPTATDQLTSLTGFFNDIKGSVNGNYDSDGIEGVDPTTTNTDAWKIAMLGQYYQPLFRDPRVGGAPAAWAAQAQTDLLAQDDALYSTVAQYTNFLKDARAGEATANWARKQAAEGTYNFEASPEHDIAPLEARIDTLRDKFRVVEDPTGPLPKNERGGLNTDAQETGYWAHQCWNLVELGNDDDRCYATGAFYAPAVAALAAFRAAPPKPLNFFSVWWRGDFKNWFGPNKSNGTWRWADRVCKEHKNYNRTGTLNLKLPNATELDAFGAFLAGTPSHLPGTPGMELAEKFLWETTEFKGWEWVAAPANWIGWSWAHWRAGNPDKPWACIRQGGPFAMPQIVFE
jgi:hypothetical protein